MMKSVVTEGAREIEKRSLASSDFILRSSPSLSTLSTPLARAHSRSPPTYVRAALARPHAMGRARADASLTARTCTSHRVDSDAPDAQVVATRH